jgi:hypothetical protein
MFKTADVKKWMGVSLLCSAALWGCKDETEPATDVAMGREYYPVQVGKFIEYNVDSFFLNDFDCSTTPAHYQVRDEVTDTFTDNSGQPGFIVTRSKRGDSTQLWGQDKAYYVTPLTTRMESSEDNLRFIKVTFPVKNNYTWKGNVYINTNTEEYQFYADWRYKYQQVGQPYNTGFKEFTNTASVLGIDHSDLDTTEIAPYNSYTYFAEVYAKDVGLVSREFTYWRIDTALSDNNCKKGFKIIMKAYNNN